MRRRILASLGGKALPYNYKVEYAHFDGSVYVDTYSCCSSHDKIDAMFLLDKYSDGNLSCYLYGCRVVGSCFGYNTNINNSYLLWKNQTGYAINWQPPLNKEIHIEHDITGLYVDGIRRGGFSDTFTNDEYSMYIGWGNGTSHAELFGRCYCFEVVGRNKFIPVVKNGICCFYDELSTLTRNFGPNGNGLYYPARGSLTPGPEV